MKAAIDVTTTSSDPVVLPRSVRTELLACPLCQVDLSAVRLSLGDSTCPQCRQGVWVMQDKGRKHLLDARRVPDEVRAWLQSVFIQLEINSIEALDGKEADSLETLSLIMELEDAFEVRVSAPGAADIRTIGDALRFLEGQLRQRHGGQ